MTGNKGFVATSVTMFYNSVLFLACFYKIVTLNKTVYLNLICLFFQNIGIFDYTYFASCQKLP